MQAARYYGQKDVRIEDIDEPSGLNRAEIRVAPTACGICGSDLHEYVDGPIFPPADEPHPITGETIPITLGHEFGGEVIEVGEGVTDMSVGDTVTVNPSVHCGDCRYCESGVYRRCEQLAGLGMHGDGGGFSEEVVVNEEQAFPFPDSLPTEYSALVEPLSVGLHAIRTSPLTAGDDVAIFGNGPIGLGVIQAARAAGADTIYTVEPQDSRRDIAEQVGADETLDPVEMDVVEHIHTRTGGGVDVSFEVAGVEQSLQDAIVTTSSGGHTTVVSIFEETVEVDPNAFVSGERTLSGILGYGAGPNADTEFGPVISMLESGTLDPEPLITSQIDLEQIVDNGFEALLDPDREEVKILVEL